MAINKWSGFLNILLHNMNGYLHKMNGSQWQPVIILNNLNVTIGNGD